MLEQVGASWTSLGVVVVSALVVGLALSLLFGLRAGEPFDDELMRGVRGAERLP